MFTIIYITIIIIHIITVNIFSNISSFTINDKNTEYCNNSNDNPTCLCVGRWVEYIILITFNANYLFV